MAKRQHVERERASETLIDRSGNSTPPAASFGYATEWNPSLVASSAVASAVSADPEVQTLRDAKRELLASLGGMHSLASAGPVAAAASVSPDSFPPCGLSNIKGIGWGLRVVQGALFPELTVKVLVGRKLPMSQIAPEARIHPAVAGVPVDVEEVGEIRATGYTLGGRYPRPAPCGASCANPRVAEGGTIGAMVILTNGKLGFLSNNHVIAHQYDNANPYTPRGQIGDPIVQPGLRIPGTSPPDDIGQLEICVPLMMGGMNFVDAAVAVTSSSLVSPQHGPHPGGHSFSMPPNPTSYLPTQQELPLNVLKVGVTTGLTMGQLYNLELDGLKVSYGPKGLYGTATFDNQFAIWGGGGAFGIPGDSGSLVVEKQSRRPVGLFFACSADHKTGYATPIDVVRSRLGIHRIIGGSETPPYQL